MPYFFDTNVIRYLSTGLAGQPLPQEHKSRVVVSAVSAIELVLQIGVSPQEALDAVHTFENWLDTGKAILLDWSETFVGEHVFVSTGIKGSQNHRSEGYPVFRASSAGTR